MSALASAQRVMILGVDQMAFFASYLRHLLALLDIRAEVIAELRDRTRSPASAELATTRS